MSEFKENWKLFWKNVWECVKASLLALIMYFAASSFLFMMTMQDEKVVGFTGGRIAWVVGCALVALAYHGFLMYANGGTGYEMLVSGNMKRMSAGGTGVKISSHKEEKEYRAWRGFASGVLVTLFVVAAGVFMGANQTAIDLALADPKNNPLSTGLAIGVLIVYFLSGWSVLPFYFMAQSGVVVSYYWSCLLGVLPILVSGIFYIVGAYGRRNKAIREQELADKAAAAEAAKPKKINYGGLPGTKPKKRK